MRGLVDLMPHGYCLATEPWLIAVLVMGNALVAFAYFAIPLLLHRRLPGLMREPSLRRILILFAGFILACGLSHAAMILTLFVGGRAYALQAAIVVVTGCVSIGTAASLYQVRHLNLRRNRGGFEDTL